MERERVLGRRSGEKKEGQGSAWSEHGDVVDDHINVDGDSEGVQRTAMGCAGNSITLDPLYKWNKGVAAYRNGGRAILLYRVYPGIPQDRFWA